MESLCRVIVQRRYRLLRLVLWKTFRSKLNAIPAVGKNCSPSHRNRVHLQTGMLFGITTEWCSASDRNRVHLRPDSPSQRLAPWFSPSLMEFTPKDSSCSDENEARSLAHNEACSCNEQQAKNGINAFLLIIINMSNINTSIPTLLSHNHFRKVCADSALCSRVGWCSPLQICLGRDISEKSIARAYTGLHGYTRDRKVGYGVRTGTWIGAQPLICTAMLKNLISNVGRLGFSGPNIIPRVRNLPAPG